MEGAAALCGIPRARLLSTANATNLQLWRTSALERIAKVRRTSSEVRKVPGAVKAEGVALVGAGLYPE